MKKIALVSLVGLTAIALVNPGWAAGPAGGAGGSNSGGFSGGGGHSGGGSPGGGAGSRGGGVGFGRPTFSGRPSYYYSRGMHYANSGAGQMRSSVRRSPSVSRPDFHGNNAAARPARTSTRPGFNGRMDHIAERHDQNWHRDWDRRHSHFANNRFFVFIDGSWCGLDAGFFPWDYYPYYAYDYYPYDYYPGYYADSEPNYYDENVYSNEPMVDPTVTAVQTQLTQAGFYNGPVDGIFSPLTRDAVAKYQIARQLNVTGSLSPDTLQSFGLAPATGG